MRCRKVQSEVFLGPGRSGEKTWSCQEEVLHGLNPSIWVTQDRELDRRRSWDIQTSSTNSLPQAHSTLLAPTWATTAHWSGVLLEVGRSGDCSQDLFTVFSNTELEATRISIKTPFCPYLREASLTLIHQGSLGSLTWLEHVGPAGVTWWLSE